MDHAGRSMGDFGREELDHRLGDNAVDLLLDSLASTDSNEVREATLSALLNIYRGRGVVLGLTSAQASAEDDAAALCD